MGKQRCCCFWNLFLGLQLNMSDAESISYPQYHKPCCHKMGPELLISCSLSWRQARGLRQDDTIAGFSSCACTARPTEPVLSACVLLIVFPCAPERRRRWPVRLFSPRWNGRWFWQSMVAGVRMHYCHWAPAPTCPKTEEEGAKPCVSSFVGVLLSKSASLQRNPGFCLHLKIISLLK